MPRIYRCAGRLRQVCDYESETKWVSRCPKCKRYYDILVAGEENPINTLEKAMAKEVQRISTGLKGFDHVLGGGGFVPGTTALISGEPGLGKSSLLLTVAANIATAAYPVIYASGEETIEDIGSLAARIKIDPKHLTVLGNQGDIYEIGEKVEEGDPKPRLLIVDSAATAFCSDLKGDEGSPAQIKGVLNYLTALGKRTKVCIIAIMHVDKAGSLAGPRVAEHLCDCVLELNSAKEFDDDGEAVDATKDWIELAVRKNRRGPSDVTCLFERRADGIFEIEKKSPLDPSSKPKHKRPLLTSV